MPSSITVRIKISLHNVLKVFFSPPVFDLQLPPNRSCGDRTVIFPTSLAPITTRQTIDWLLMVIDCREITLTTASIASQYSEWFQ